MTVRLASLLLVSTLMLGACNGGSSGIDSPTGLAFDESASGSFNGGLTGRLLTSIGGKSISIDLATGQHNELPMNIIDDAIEAEGDEINFDSRYHEIYASDQTADAALVQTYLRCVEVEPEYYGNGCYAVYNSDLTQLGSIRRLNSRELDDGARLSRSRQSLVTVDHHRVFFESDNMNHVEIWNVATGDLEKLLTIRANFTQFADYRLGAPPVEWGLNDALIYSDAGLVPPRIFVTKPDTYAVDRTIKLPSRFRGIISRLHLSPDGSKLLMEYERHGYGATFPIILDMQSLALTIPARHALDVESSGETAPSGDADSTLDITTHGWSPDGNWILLGHRYPVDIGSSGVGIRTALSAVPASSEYALLSPYPDEQSAEVVRLVNYSGNELEYLLGNRQYVWLP